jgi:hypothetical protein
MHFFQGIDFRQISKNNYQQGGVVVKDSGRAAGCLGPNSHSWDTGKELLTRSYLKKVDQGSGQGAGRRKSGAYAVVCEHFEPTRNAAMGP